VKVIKISLIVGLFCSITTYNKETITVIGLGRLGLCTALCLEHAGFAVLGVDIVAPYVEKINNKTFVSNEPQVNEYLQKSTHFKATTSLEEGLNFSDIYFIIIDTPSSPHEAYDHSKLNRLLSTINNYKVKDKHIVICCTIFPGYIRNTAHSLLKDCENISISYNPEFIAQGSIIHDFENPDMILIGQGSLQAGDRLESIYREACKNNPKMARMSPESAEITKLAINCFITTKIAFANMVGDIADQTSGANKFDILAAVGSDSRIGLKYLKPGYGFGGPCFPRDNRALGTYAEKVGIEPTIPYATDTANKLHAQYMAHHLIKRNQNEYIFEDVNYKNNCPVVIIEESQKLAVAEILAKKGYRVVIKDRTPVIKEVQEKYGSLFIYDCIN
jgi:nucleotide sugar dehydrogenase